MFFDDSKQQIEKKMMLLKGIAFLDVSTHDSLLELMIQDERMNYFEFTHYLNEILEAALVLPNGKNGYKLTNLGVNAIRFFSDRLETNVLTALKNSATAFNVNRPAYVSVWESLDGFPALRLSDSNQGTRLLVRLENRIWGDTLARAWESQDRQNLEELLGALALML